MAIVSQIRIPETKTVTRIMKIENIMIMMIMIRTPKAEMVTMILIMITLNMKFTRILEEIIERTIHSVI